MSVSVIWHKVWRDLMTNKARTALVVAATASGVFALGLVFGLSGVLGERLTRAHREALPSHITFQGGPFSPETVDAIEAERGVERAQGEIVVHLLWRFEDRVHRASDDGGTGWRDGTLVARADYEEQTIDLLRDPASTHPLEAGWIGERLPHNHLYALGLDRLSMEHFAVAPGRVIQVKAGSRHRRASVEGAVHAYDVLSPAWGGTATFYGAPESAVWLTSYRNGAVSQGAMPFNRLQVRLETFTRADAKETAERIEARLERMGLEVVSYEIKDPRQHPMQEQVDAVLIVLGVMGTLSLGLSGFLIVNVINAILARQLQQIGVMKAVGATLLRIVRIYLGITLVYGGLALLLAVPLGLVGAQLVAVWLLDSFNVTLNAWQPQPLAVGVQAAVGLTVPPAAALAPVLNAARITVREAIDDYGLGDTFGEGPVDRAMSQLRGLPRSVALAMRNAFRRKRRVVLTLVMLSFSGAMFTTVLSTHTALKRTFHIIFELEGDVAVSIERPHPAGRLIEITQKVAGVQRVEVWQEHLGTASRPDPLRTPGSDPGGREVLSLVLTGVPSGSRFFHPRILAGRDLRSGDGRAILVNNRLVAEENVAIGDLLELQIDGTPSEWTVVGSYLSLNVLQDVCYVPREALGRETHSRGEGTVVKALTHADGTAAERRVIEGLTAALERQNVEVAGSYSTSQQWQESQSAFSVLIYLLLAMAILVALVGSIGLMSTMSINVVERTREIGVMRAIGATPRTIVAIFVAEGVLVGALSWLLALPFSAVGAYGLGAVVGQAIVQIPLDFSYSVGGVLLWLLIVIALSALASLWPAARATQVSVRESLAYE